MPATEVLLVDDDPAICRIVPILLKQHGLECLAVQSGQAGLVALKEMAPVLAIVDLNMPAMNGLAFIETAHEMGLLTEFIVMTGAGSIDSAVKAMKLGAFDFLEKPVKPDILVVQVQRAIKFAELRQENTRLRRTLGSPDSLPAILTNNEKMEKVIAYIDEIARHDATVLLLGETGTGKDLFARLLHAKSERRAQPFIALNCTAVQDPLFESELFGAEKGAYTGAVETRIGLFEAASDGTLFLDEVGDLSAGVQGKLLRALESGEFRRLGSVKTLHSNARLIAATNRDLQSLCDQGRFRLDLMYRLNQITVCIPPLRDRPEDIPLLAQHFLRGSARRFGKEAPSLSSSTMKILCSHKWPGNVRELSHVIDRIVLGSQDALPLTRDPLPTTSLGAPTSEAPPAHATMEDLERWHILRTLQAQQGAREETAHILGISTRTLARKLARYGLA